MKWDRLSFPSFPFFRQRPNGVIRQKWKGFEDDDECHEKFDSSCKNISVQKEKDL